MKDFFDAYYAVGEHEGAFPIGVFITSGLIYLIFIGIWFYFVFVGDENEDNTVNFLMIGLLVSIIIGAFWPIISPIATVVLAMMGLSKLVKKWGENYRTLQKGADLDKVDKTLDEMKDLVDGAENHDNVKV